MSVLGLMGCDVCSVRPSVVPRDGLGTFGIIFVSSDRSVSVAPMSGTLGFGICDFDNNSKCTVFFGSSSGGVFSCCHQ